MKKLVMLSAMTMLSLAGVAVSQAETTASASASSVAPASSASTTASVTATIQPTKKGEAPKDPPQVQKLISLYPQLIARIAPQGKVCFEGQECDITIAATLGPADPNNPRDGKMIYDGVCHTCHASGLLSAPKYGDKGDWSARIGKGVATLHSNAINGFNAMPAKGGKADLLDQEVKNAVDYMLDSVK